MNEHRTSLQILSKHVEHQDLGKIDAKQRKIGVRITTGVKQYESAAPNANCWYTQPAGVYYYAELQATRDGKKYGASQPDRLYASIEERAAAIAQYIEERRAK